MSPSPPIYLLVGLIVTLHLLIAHFVFGLSFDPFLLPDPTRSLLLLLAISAALHLARPLLVKRIHAYSLRYPQPQPVLPVVDTEADKPTITAMTTSTGEPRNELWWAWYAAIYHWVAFASLWLAILWSHEPKVNLAWWPFSIMGAVGGFVSVGVIYEYR